VGDFKGVSAAELSDPQAKRRPRTKNARFFPYFFFVGRRVRGGGDRGVRPGQPGVPTRSTPGRPPVRVALGDEPHPPSSARHMGASRGDGGCCKKGRPPDAVLLISKGSRQPAGPLAAPVQAASRVTCHAETGGRGYKTAEWSDPCRGGFVRHGCGARAGPHGRENVGPGSIALRKYPQFSRGFSCGRVPGAQSKGSYAEGRVPVGKPALPRRAQSRASVAG